MRDLQMTARRNVAKRFQDNNVKMMDIGELYSRRDDGTVVFNNPDDPHRPFQSRAEAQQWIDSMNAQITAAYNKEVAKEQQELYKNVEPSVRLLQFAPVYDAMDQVTREVFEELIEPYAIIGANNEPIGFSCNLETMGRQAVRLASRFGSAPQQQAQPVQQAAEPAMDIKASPSGTGTAEPRDINEAMRMLNEQRRKK